MKNLIILAVSSFLLVSLYINAAGLENETTYISPTHQFSK